MVVAITIHQPQIPRLLPLLAQQLAQRPSIRPSIHPSVLPSGQIPGFRCMTRALDPVLEADGAAGEAQMRRGCCWREMREKDVSSYFAAV